MLPPHHFEPLLHGRSTLEVLGRGLDVKVDRFLGQIDHVAGEERLAVLLEVTLVLVEHAIEPGQQLLGAVIRVQHDGDAVDGRDAADVVGGGNRAGDGCSLTVIADALMHDTHEVSNPQDSSPSILSPTRSLSSPFQRSKQHRPERIAG